MPGGPFVPGDPRINRKGRAKKGQTLTDILEKHGRKRDVQKPDGTQMSRKEALAQAMWKLALAGDVAAIKYIYDRIDGKPTETVRHGGDEDMPPIQIQYLDPDEEKYNPDDDVDAELDDEDEDTSGKKGNTGKLAE